MKKQFLKPIMLCGVFTLASVAFTSCNIKNKTAEIVAVAEETESNEDATNVRTETDAAIDEVNQVLLDNDNSKARTDAGYVNNIRANSVTLVGDSIIINYEGNYSKDLLRTRTGDVVIRKTSTQNFGEQGCTFSVHFKNLKVTRTYDQKSIVLNGTHIVENITGGFARQAFVLESTTAVSHKITGNMAITFDDASVRTWSINRKRTIDFKQVGIDSVGANTPIEQGNNRRGNAFATSIVSTVVTKLDSSCGVAASRLKLTSGQVKHTVNSVATVVKFGYSDATTLQTDFCAVKGYVVTWTKDSKTYGPRFIQIYK